ncbi:ATP-binding protein, partial [Actinoplanes sp. TFC3]|uniref:ATP-binding protein n=1 Tax=Actinoplanes sp. TFC3 TaxID=1710355 RepID=UPI00137AF2F8
DLSRRHGPDPRRIGGRGLLLVAAMTRDWGTQARPGGKVVWADVPLSDEEPRPAAVAQQAPGRTAPPARRR